MPSHTIAQNLQRLQTARTNIASAITTKGGTVATGAGFEDFSTAIGTIPSGGSATLITKNINANGTYNASSDNADGYSSVTVNVPTGGGGSTELLSVKSRLKAPSSIDTRTWIALGSTMRKEGNLIWTDGDYTYYSKSGTNTVLGYSGSSARVSWSSKTWTGFANITGSSIWTDGTNIYYSNSTTHQILDKSTYTWRDKTWNGLNNFNGGGVWTDGTDIYYSAGANQYVLDKATSTWSPKTWNGFSEVYGSSIWTDGTDIYYTSYVSASSRLDCYVLNKATSTWETKTWTGWPSSYAYGYNIWTDGTNIYYSAASSGINLVLDKATSTWNSMTWTGLTAFDGQYVWTDGNTIFYSNNTSAYYLVKPVTGIAKV